MTNRSRRIMPLGWIAAWKDQSVQLRRRGREYRSPRESEENLRAAQLIERSAQRVTNDTRRQPR